MGEYIKKNGITKLIARCGIISAIYIVLSLITFSFSSGVVQFRIGECLTLLPLILPESIISNFVGCFIINIITGCVIFDTVFGSLITLVAGILTYLVGKKIKSLSIKIIIGGFFPVFLNAFLLPITWYFAGLKQEQIYMLQVLSLTISQALSVYIPGSFLVIKFEKNKLFVEE